MITPCSSCIAIVSLQNAGESDRFAEETALKSSDPSLLSSSNGMVFLGNILVIMPQHGACRKSMSLPHWPGYAVGRFLVSIHSILA
jgi:hypothetical protein